MSPVEELHYILSGLVARLHVLTAASRAVGEEIEFALSAIRQLEGE